MKKLAIALTTFTVFITNSIADTCSSTWYWDDIPVEMTPCLYSGGGSGYIKFENTSSKDIEICWTINYYDGYKTKGCRYRFHGYGKMSPSEYHLSKSKIRSIRITKFRYHK